jgi:ABC-2 type transport system permease protein
MAVLRHSLFSLRWQILSYGVGMGLYAALIVSLFPMLEDTFAEMEMPEGYLAFFGSDQLDFGDPRAFLTAELMSLVPLIVAIYAVVASTGLLASDEQRGALDLVLAQPLSRRRLFLERTGGLVVGALLIATAGAIGLVIPALIIDLDISVFVLVRAMFNLVPLMLACAGLGLLVAAVTPSRGVAGGLVAAETVAVWLLNSISNLNDTLEPLHFLSPFYYGDSPRALFDGPVAWHVAVLLGAFLLLTALALRAFEARELSAGRWQLRALTARNA